MRGDEIPVLLGWINFIEEHYRNRDSTSVPDELRPYFNVFKRINLSLEHMVLTAIEMYV